MKKTILLIGFSTTGKSSLLKRAQKKAENPDSILTVDTDSIISEPYGGSIADIFYKYGRHKALEIIEKVECDFLQSFKASPLKPSIIAAGPAIPIRSPYYDEFIRRIQPEIILLEKSAEEIYQSLQERSHRMKEEQKEKHQRPDFGIWDIGVMTRVQGDEIVPETKEKAIKNIQTQLMQRDSYYKRYRCQTISASEIFRNEDFLPFNI